MKTIIVTSSDIAKNGFNFSAKDMIAYKEKQQNEPSNKKE
jgi:hypothetical protein